MTDTHHDAQYQLCIITVAHDPSECRLLFHRAPRTDIETFLPYLGQSASEPHSHHQKTRLIFREAAFLSPWSRHAHRFLSILGCPGPFHITRAWITSDPSQGQCYATPTDWLGILSQYQTQNVPSTLIDEQYQSEHCRHHFFYQTYIPNGTEQPHLMGMIASTRAYLPTLPTQDHAGIYLVNTSCPLPCLSNGHYTQHTAQWHYVIKTETHNYPTALEPWIGAATGIGGELRDISATGRGGRPQAGFYGLVLSDPLRSPQAADIWQEAPQGVAHYANEFGRPTLLGFLRVYERRKGTRDYAFDKPILLTGGIGRTAYPEKKNIIGAHLYLIGGPTLPIAIGQAKNASETCQDEGTASEPSHQWCQPEIQRSCQYVIEQCSAHFCSIHDLGAGGLINALLELMQTEGVGLTLSSSTWAPTALPQDPIAYLCNESQERFLCILPKESAEYFLSCCQKEHCPVQYLGTLTDEARCAIYTDQKPLIWHQNQCTLNPESIHIAPPTEEAPPPFFDRLCLSDATLSDLAMRILAHPSVASKHRLIHRFDRSVGGLTAYDSVVGPYQITVGDFALTLDDYAHEYGMAFAIGERIPIATEKPCASVEMALGEAITNLCGAGIPAIADICISANWMADCSQPEEAKHLASAVAHLVDHCCHPLKIGIITGKDSLSMSRIINNRRRFSPVSLVVGAFAQTAVSAARTPVLETDQPADLFLIDLSRGRTRLGNSILETILDTTLGDSPRVDDWTDLQSLPDCLSALRQAGCLLAYHDRSDGGVWATLCEMAIASRCGMSLILDTLCFDIHLSDVDRLGTQPGFLAGRYKDHLFAALFHEELGVVIQTPKDKRPLIGDILRAHNLYRYTHLIGQTQPEKTSIDLYQNAQIIFSAPLTEISRHWFHTDLSTNRVTEAEELNHYCEMTYPALYATRTQARPAPHKRGQPRRALIMRAPGSHGHHELAAVLDHVGFAVEDITLQDCVTQAPEYRPELLIISSGFSFSDFPSPGEGWKNYANQYPSYRHFMQQMFQDPNTLLLGICNGCQILSQLQELMPCPARWPQWTENHSQQFESRIVQTTILDSPSHFLHSLIGESLPLVIAHRYGCSHTEEAHTGETVIPCLSFTHEHYPVNPTGTPEGYTGFTSPDGRILGLMPHPERQFLWRQNGLQRFSKETYTPWIEIFYNAYQY